MGALRALRISRSATDRDMQLRPLAAGCAANTAGAGPACTAGPAGGLPLGCGAPALPPPYTSALKAPSQASCIAAYICDICITSVAAAELLMDQSSVLSALSRELARPMW